MLANTLIHREYTRPYIAKFIIEKDKMYTENACRAARYGVITPENLDPVPKNPIIASFFNQIGNADELGSGTRNLFKYTKIYSSQNPELFEDDIFRITVPLVFKSDNVETPTNERVSRKTVNKMDITLSENQQKIIAAIKNNPSITQKELAEIVGISDRHINKNMIELQQLGLIERIGNNRKREWMVRYGF